MSEKMVELCKAQGQMQGELIRSVMEGNNIHCLLVGSGIASTFAFSVGPASDVLVFVPESQLEQALTLLETLYPADGDGSASDADAEVEEIDEG